MLQDDAIPERYLGAGGDAALRAATTKTIRGLRIVRGLLVGFTWLSAVTMLQLATRPTADIGGTEARPAMAGMAILSTLFGVILTWRSGQQHRALALRVETVARWMVATGVTVTFAVAVTVRPELMMSFGIPGVYLLLAAPSLVATVLLRQRLARLDTLAVRRHSLARATDRTPEPAQSEADRRCSWLRVTAVVIGVGVVAMAAASRRGHG